MPKVILQPAGSGPASKHFNNTILNTVSLRRCAEFISAPDVAELAAVYGREGARVWGVTPGDAFRNKKKWDLIDPGDAVLFCGKGEVFANAFVKHKLHNRKLAIDLWGKDEKGQTWEYIYFVSAPLTHSINYKRLASVIGFSPDFIVMGFMVLDEEKSAKVLHEFQLADD
jgi:hypothetical protein